MGRRNLGLSCDPLFVAATRPAMRWGVTYSALLANLVFTMETFLLSRNLLALLLAAPLHGIAMLLCARDARFFDLLLLWGRTRLTALLGNQRFWKASSYAPLRLDLAPRRRSRRLRSARSLCAYAAISPAVGPSAHRGPACIR
jgi:type IV secretion system protein VirB3